MEEQRFSHIFRPAEDTSAPSDETTLCLAELSRDVSTARFCSLPGSSTCQNSRGNQSPDLTHAMKKGRSFLEMCLFDHALRRSITRVLAMRAWSQRSVALGLRKHVYFKVGIQD